MFQSKIINYKASEEAYVEKARLYDQWFYELEWSHEERMKSYEEQIYALTQELKHKQREIESGE